MRKLTIGMCVYDDFNGLYFTIQAIRTFHREVINDLEFVIINNNPGSEQGKAVKDFVYSHIKEPFQYLEFTKYSSTTIKTKIFELADTPYVMSVDCHVLIQPGALKKLIDYYDSGLDDGNLLQGPLIHDSLDGTVSTHFNDKWGSGMKGQWAFDARYKGPDSEPFEIHGQGMGLFSCRKDKWLGYNKHFRGFGGEEIYIQDKYKAHGKKTMCLPFLGWVHRFTRIGGVPYPNKWEDRYRNYILGRFELRQDIADVEENYKKLLSEEVRHKIKTEAYQLIFNEGSLLGGVKEGILPRSGAEPTLSKTNTNDFELKPNRVVSINPITKDVTIRNSNNETQVLNINEMDRSNCGCKKNKNSFASLVNKERVKIEETAQGKIDNLTVKTEESNQVAKNTISYDQSNGDLPVKKPCGCKGPVTTQESVVLINEPPPSIGPIEPVVVVSEEMAMANKGPSEFVKPPAALPDKKPCGCKNKNKG